MTKEFLFLSLELQNATLFFGLCIEVQPFSPLEFLSVNWRTASMTRFVYFTLSLRICNVTTDCPLLACSFGKVKPGGGKWYKGHSADHAWNHDLLWKTRVNSENGLIGIAHEDNVPLHLQHLQKLKPLKKKKTARPATAVEERLHRSAAQEIKALQAEIAAEVRKRDHLESKLRKVIAVSCFQAETICCAR